MSKNILFITEQLFKERTGASNQIDGKQLFPMIKVAGDMYIQPALGSQLYKRLQTGIENDDLTNDEKLLIDEYITDTLIWYTMSLLPMALGFQLFSKGFLQKTSEESQTPSRADLELIEQKYQSMAEFYKKRLIGYLRQYWTLYSDYINITIGHDVIFPQLTAYECPVNLDLDMDDCCGSSSSSNSMVNLRSVSYTTTGDETSFVVYELTGKTIVSASRSGLTKTITTSPTNDTGYLQINGNTITLPTGDIAMADELFTFLYY